MASTLAFSINEGHCPAVVSGGQITIRAAIPSNSIRAAAAASWWRAARRMDRPDNSLRPQSPRVEPCSKSPIATLARAPHRKRTEQSARLNWSRMDLTGLGGVLIELDEISERHWWRCDIGISK